MLLSNDEFFATLQSLLATQSSRAHGSVFLTQKRIPLDNKAATSEANGAENTGNTSSDYSVLVRATNGARKSRSDGKVDKSQRVKASTVVARGDVEAFYARYAEVCKGGMVAMKKRDRSARKKGKGKGKK